MNYTLRVPKPSEADIQGKKRTPNHMVFFHYLFEPYYCTSEQENFGEDVEGNEDQ